VTLLELIDAHATAIAEAHTAENLGDIEHWEREAFKLRAEVERRLKLADMDHTIMWRVHLDDTERSQQRQRAIIVQGAADGRHSGDIIDYCRKDLG